jgi:hypothetical protein
MLMLQWRFQSLPLFQQLLDPLLQLQMQSLCFVQQLREPKLRHAPLLSLHTTLATAVSWTHSC